MSSYSDKPTLVMGARGSVGRLVLDGLLSRGLPVRASVRRPQPGELPTGVTVYAADLTEPGTLAPAFDGVRQVFLYANPVGVQEVVDAARAAGIERIVLMSSGSVIHPSSAGNSITEEHRGIEHAFAAASDLTVVPIRPLVLATNALGWARSIRAGRRVALYSPDALTAPIHERDIAGVAVAALLDDGLGDPTGMLTGPARLSQRDQVTAIGAAIGAEVAVEELAREEAGTHLSRFMTATDAEAVLQFLDDAAAGGSPATDSVEQVLGRPATGFDTWAADHVGDFA
jgi:uncharacterized protein YbjT (DUF2867 family)